MMDPLPTLNKAFSKLLQIERQKTVKVDNQISAFNVTYSKTPVGKK